MIELTTGDILKADAHALVNTVNCVGAMGRGIALQFRNAFPENFTAYAAACKRGEVRPGQMFVFATGRMTGPRYIVNFPTKRHWRGKSFMEDIDSGLDALVAEIARLKLQSIAIPPLGCGLGGLSWPAVRRRIEKSLAPLQEVRVLLFEPSEARGTREHVKPAEPPKMTGGRAALVGLMNRYLAGLMDPFVSLLEVHKLMYFMQEAGEPLRLRFVKAPYGPYADNLRHVLERIEGHLVTGYAEGGDEPEKPLELVPGAAAKAETLLAEHPATRERFDRVADLVGGFETPFGLELLSTVHWVATRERASTATQAEQRTFAWSERKKRFSPGQIRLTWEVLRDKGWLPAKVDEQGAH